ncbi:hypothetical protein [Leucothrix arctica]|uniref:Uncharacterized protein n=1 Tax=Leucothrix arctica TaxID=1481894 RepID=A0A317C7Q7_9GAMM|nr:hypothetical protein [Leucothrix arctica]PWQ94301.1 hypothetical protein DKT75_16200 [Leucothrix arctica]
MIFVTFNPLEIHQIEGVPNVKIEIAGDIFIDVNQKSIDACKFDGFLGFYDWLINSSDDVIGVYLMLADHSKNILSYISGFENISIEADGSGVFIFFSENKDFDESRSNSESFGCNRLYTTESGQIAMSFELPEVGRVVGYK